MLVGQNANLLTIIVSLNACYELLSFYFLFPDTVNSNGFLYLCSFVYRETIWHFGNKTWPFQLFCENQFVSTSNFFNWNFWYWMFFITILIIVTKNECINWVEMALFWVFWLSLEHLLQSPYHFVTCTDIHVNYWDILMLLNNFTLKIRLKWRDISYITWLHFVLCLTLCFITKFFCFHLFHLLVTDCAH